MPRISSWRAYFEELLKKYKDELNDLDDFEHQNVEFQITGAEDGKVISEEKNGRSQHLLE